MIGGRWFFRSAGVHEVSNRAYLRYSGAVGTHKPLFRGQHKMIFWITRAGGIEKSGFTLIHLFIILKMRKKKWAVYDADFL
jgi:hypothetical protein